MHNLKRITPLTVTIFVLLLCCGVLYAAPISKSVTYKAEFKPFGDSHTWEQSIPPDPGAPIALDFKFLLSGGTLTAQLGGNISFDQDARTIVLQGTHGQLHSTGGVQLTGDIVFNTTIPLSIFEEGASISINHTQKLPGFPNIDKSWNASEGFSSFLLSGSQPESVALEAGIPKLITQQISAVKLSAIIGSAIVSGGTLTAAASQLVDYLTEYIDGGIIVNGGVKSNLKLRGERITVNGGSVVSEGQPMSAPGFDPSQDFYRVYSEYEENFTYTLDFAVSADIYANLNVLLLDIFTYEKEINEAQIPMLPEKSFDLAFVTNPNPVIFPINNEDDDDDDDDDDNTDNGDEPDDGNPIHNVDMPDPRLRDYFLSCLNSANSGRAPADQITMTTYMERYTELSMSGVSDITGLEHMINASRLYLGGNNISDISPLAELTKLESLELYANNISDISPLAELNTLKRLELYDNDISDISALAGLDALEGMNLANNNISDISALAGLDALEGVNLANNNISDISPLVELNALKELSLAGNSISDISLLVGANTPQHLDIHNNPLDYLSIYTHIPALKAEGIAVRFNNRIPATLAKISGDTQSAPPKTRLNPFVVEVEDQNGVPFPGVPVTFAVTVGAGTLSFERTTTDRNGKAQSTLTLGKTDATVTVSVLMVDRPVIFTTAVASEDHIPNPTLPKTIANVHIPDPMLRAELNRRLIVHNKELETPTTMETYLAGVTRLDLSQLGIRKLNGLERATKLEYLSLADNRISDISALKGLSALRSLVLSRNNVSDLSALSGLTALLNLWLDNNGVSDLSALSGLTDLKGLYLGKNIISDISALKGLRNTLTHLDLESLPLDNTAVNLYIPMLQARGVTVFFSLRVPDALTKLSGDKQAQRAGTRLQPFVVEVKDTDGIPFAGAPVTFVVTTGDGTLSTERTVADTTGRAESTLTLGNALTTVVTVSVWRDGPQTNFTATREIRDVSEKITGPWLWMIAPTETGQGGAASTDVDSLAAASNGTVTETMVATHGANAGERVGRLEWTLGEIAATGGNNINEVVTRIGLGQGDINDHSAYALIILESTTDQQNVPMKVGSDDSVKVWLNGEVVHRNPINRGSGDFQDNFRVNLRQGDNILLVKVSERGGGWSMFTGVGGIDLDIVSFGESTAVRGDEPTRISTREIRDVSEKITGPWLWMIAPTETGQGGAASTDVDSLAAASNGTVTETMVATHGANAGERVGRLEWTLGEIAATGGNNINEVVTRIGLGQGDINDHSAYALIILESTTDQQNVPMKVGSDDSVKVWLNGEVVHRNPINRGSGDFQDNFRVNLRQGDNILLVKVSERGVDWSMFTGVGGIGLDIVSFGESTAVDSENLVLYLPFDEGIGTTAADLSAHQNHGTLYKASWTRGKYGSSIELSGEPGGWVEVPDAPSLDITDEITLMAWVCPTQFTSESLRMVVKTWIRDTTPWMAYGLYHEANTNGRPRFSISVNGQERATLAEHAPQLPLDEWTHLAATYDGTQMKLYYNGELEAEMAATGKIDTNDVPLSIGRNSEGDKEHYIGLIDEVAIWNVALDESEIRQVMRGILGDTSVTTPLVAAPGISDNFDDPFEGRALQNPNWQWQNEPPNWDVGETRENFLHIEAETNRNLWTSDASHFLYQETDADTFDVETHFFTRWNTASGVNGLVVKSSADNEWVTLKFWAREAGPKGQIQYQARGRGLVADPAWRPELGTTELCFRLRKDGNTYKGYYKSREADTWIEIGTANVTLTPPLQLGIYAGVAASTGTLEVDYEYFRNTANTDVQAAPTLNAATVIIPTQTGLLPNYPNPFNPETWLPYQLSGPADVTLTIYNVQGATIRRLALGHQPAGMYHSRSRSAYWDGKNEIGESVASGIYFYTLTAGDFTATRKMLIRK